MIDIKDISGRIRFSTEINAGSKRAYALMKENYITLKFSTENPVYFKLGDGVDNEMGLFELTSLQMPTYNGANGGYDYDLRLDAYYWKWKNKIFKFNAGAGGQGTSWNLTATLDVQLGVFLQNLKALGYKYRETNFEFSIHPTVENKSLLMSYDSVNLLDALTRLAEAWECEWWINDSVIHFGRCEYSDPVDFKLGNNVEEMTRSDSRNTFATRIYAFGSTRNLPTNYRPVDENVVVNGVVQKRLMLPAGTPYMDAYRGMSAEEAIEDVVIFEDVYPRRTGTMSGIHTYEYTDVIKEEGKPDVVEEWSAYRFNDTGITFSEEYRLPGQELRITFQSGVLNGMDFAVTFNPCDKEGEEEEIPEKSEDGSWNPLAQVWEIVRNEDYGRELPSDMLVPKNGDTYILYGYDTKFIADTMIPKAEAEVKEKALKYLEKVKTDPSTYNCKMLSLNMLNSDGTAKLFEMGDRVNLINEAYFDTGNRQSRIIGFEYNLDVPYDSPVYTVGETASYSRIGALEDKIEALTYKGQTYTGGGGSGVYLITTNDNTPPSNRNVFSALRSIAMFIRKDIADSVNSITTFLKGIKIGHFIPGWIGSGGALYIDPVTGKSKLEVDEVLARDRFEAMEFRFNRIDVIDGEQWSTFAFGKITLVDVENQVAYLDLVDGELMSSHVNDLNRGIFHNISSDNAAGNKMDDCGFYTMAGFSTSYFTPTELLPGGFKYALRPGTTQHPCAEMKFAAYGNLTDSERRMSRVTNTRHTLYLKEVSTWQIDPNAHYGAAYGDLTGITINGVEFNGYSSFQTNGYFKGYIEFLPDQIEELKGNDGYSVSLTSYDAIVGVDSQGRIDHAIYDIVNIVNGEEQVVSGDSEVVATRYKIGTDIQAFKGGQALVYATTPSEGMYAASYTAIGCECYLNDGVMVITKVTADKATVKIEVNCEGKAVFIKLFTLTRVYGGVNADWIINVFCQSEEKPDAPTGEALMPEGWSDAPTGVGKWWMSKSIVNGITRLPGEWSEPVQVTCEDGGDTDFKYAKNSSESVPPSIVITDRFPNGWVDEPPMLHAGEFLWMSTTKVKPDNTLNGTWSIPVRISGEKGYAGDWTSYVFKQSQGRPSTPTGTHPKPSGWDDGPGSEGKWWMSKSSVSGVTGEARDWSTPVQVTGQDGNGMYYEYAAHHSQTDAPAGGWSPLVPAIGSGQFLWMRWGQVIPPATHPQSWAGVARVTGETGPRGQQGIQGIQGEDGRQGLTGPAGVDGSTTYFHIKYSHNPDGNPMTEDASAPYIGTYVDYYSVDSSSHYSYTWKRFQGLQGASGTQGIPGNNGHDGKTYYTHIKYSNDGGRTFTSSSGETPGDYIGFCVDLNVNDPTTVGAYKWSKTKGETGNPGEPGKPGEDANLLPWINDWNNNKTLVDNEYVVSPKMFSGTRSGNGKLTGIAQGRDCITINGAKRTGIFALVDNEVVFALDPITKEYKFRGRIEATEGEIGGFSLVGNNLVNENFGASVSIRDQDNGRYVTIGGKNNTIDVLVYGSNSTGLFIMSGDSASNDTSYAIQSYGRHFFGQRQGDTWNAPGVLWCGSYSVINWNPVLINQWGNGVRNTPSISRTGNGKYTITHGLGHTEYFVSGTAKNKTYEGDWYNSVMNYESISYNSFLVQFKCDGSKEKDPSEFQIMIFGRNKW